MQGRSVIPRYWGFEYFKGELSVDEDIETLGGYSVTVRPSPGLVKAVSEAIAALLKDQEFDGRFFADGRLEIRFHAGEDDL